VIYIQFLSRFWQLRDFNFSSSLRASNHPQSYKTFPNDPQRVRELNIFISLEMDDCLLVPDLIMVTPLNMSSAYLGVYKKRRPIYEVCGVPSGFSNKTTKSYAARNLYSWR
jgi:hypothetical protein